MPKCRIIYDKFHIMQHAGAAVDEVRQPSSSAKWRARAVVKGKRWLLLSRWVNLNTQKKRQLNAVCAKPPCDEGLSAEREPGPAVELHLRRVDVALPEELDRSAALAALLEADGEAGGYAAQSPGGSPNCRTKVPLGVVEAVNGDIKALLRRGRGYRNLKYLPSLKAQRMAATRTEFVAFQKAA